MVERRVGGGVGDHVAAAHADRLGPGLEGAGAAEVPALPQRRAQRPGQRGLLGVLDPLGEHRRAGALGLGHDGVDDAGAARPRELALHEALSSLITSGRSSGISAIDRGSTPTSSSAMPQPRLRYIATKPSRPAGSASSARSVSSTVQRSSAEERGAHLGQEGGTGAASGSGLDVDEQLLAAPEPGGDRAVDGGGPADVIEVGGAAQARGGAEEGVGRHQGRALRPAGQRLPADDRLGVEVDDGLEDRADRARGDDGLELLALRPERALDRVVSGRHTLDIGREPSAVHPAGAVSPRSGCFSNNRDAVWRPATR